MPILEIPIPNNKMEGYFHDFNTILIFTKKPHPQEFNLEDEIRNRGATPVY